MARRILHLRRVGHAGTGGSEQPSLLEFCRETSPVWELTPDGALLDVSGTERLYGRGLDGAALLCRRAGQGPRGMDLAAGTAPTVFAARLASRLAARFGPGAFAVGPGNVGAFLARFSVAWLPAKPGEVDRLRELGVRTLGDLQVVPRPLLKAVFGDRGPELADEAAGRLGRDLRGTAGRTREASSGLELVAGVRLARPLADGPALFALRRGLALRAVALRPDGVVGRGPWRLVVRHPGGGTDAAFARGSGRAGWSAWTGLLDLLWERLPRRRTGVVGAELRAELNQAHPQTQGSLFPEDGRDRRLARALARIRRSGPRGVGHAGEELLMAWDARWFGPGEDISRKGRGLVDGPGPGR